MSARYWIARYVANAVRNEAQNVGVFVEANGQYAAKFFGEREDSTLSGHALRRFAYPSVYRQWREYWRTQLTEQAMAKIHETKKENFFVEFGGVIHDTGDDAAPIICEFIYNLIVGDGPVAAYGWTLEEDTNVRLEKEILDDMQSFHVLSGSDEMVVKNPVVQGRKVKGTKVEHRPSFSQINGVLHVMEYIDFTVPRRNLLKDRAGWMAYMFGDIAASNAGAKAYSLVRPETEGGVEQLEYARAILDTQSTIVNWADQRERSAFLDARRQIGDMPAH